MTQPLTPTQPPFLMEHLRRNETPAGFTPEARLALTSTFRNCGLLATLSDEQARTLLALLSSLSPNGAVQATAWEIAELLGVSERQARRQLENLTRLKWQGEPVACLVPRDTGFPCFALSPALLTQEEVPPLEQPSALLPPAAGREAVIAHSRTTYARPREEVEREIARLNGWDVPEAYATPDEKALAAVRQKLRVIGLTAEQADDLLARFDLARIQRQLYWLPYRRAKHPIGFLIAAIEGDYDAPAALRQIAEEALSHQTGSALSDTASQEEQPDPPFALPEEGDFTPETAAQPAAQDSIPAPTLEEPEPRTVEPAILDGGQAVSLQEEQIEESI